MKIKVVNKSLANFDKDFDVLNINFDNVLIEDNYEKVSLKIKDVEIIPENKYEDVISECKDVLKIKLNKGVSIAFYTALTNCIREVIGCEITEIEVLKDEYRTMRKGMWEKNLVLVINSSTPLELHVVGTKYDKTFSISSKTISLDDFIDGCKCAIRCLESEICEKQKSLSRFKKAINKVVINSSKTNGDKIKKLTAS